MNFSKSLINWYRINKRDLPWRQTTDPYKIWVSEIILQQTRVNQGWDYYLRFIERFPEVETLARATEQEVLKQWQGLGYYSRARNMHRAAKTIVEDFNGTFPSEYESILSLKGIGEYTAAAISSIAFNNPYPVIDGNVLRVISRIFGIYEPVDSPKGKAIIKAKLDDLIDKKYPSDFNQGIMELGALICKPKSPDCHICVFKDNCLACLNNEMDILPVKIKKVKSTNRYFHYMVIQFEEANSTKIILKERISKDIWKGLNDFPLFESTIKTTPSQIQSWLNTNLLSMDFSIVGKSEEYKHILTHQIIYAQFYLVEINSSSELLEQVLSSNNWYAAEINKLTTTPFPKLIEKFIKKNF